MPLKKVEIINQDDIVDELFDNINDDEMFDISSIDKGSRNFRNISISFLNIFKEV